jgi:hypothetical protein
MTGNESLFSIDLDQPLIEQELVKSSLNLSSDFKGIKFEQLLEIAKMALRNHLESEDELRGLRLEFQSSFQVQNELRETYVIEWSQKPLTLHSEETKQNKKTFPLSTEFLGRLTQRLDEALSQAQNDSHIASFKVDFNSSESAIGYLDCKGDSRCKKNGLDYKGRYINDNLIGCTNILCGKKPDDILVD